MSSNKSIDLSHHLNTLSRSRVPSPLKYVVDYMNQPGMISLAGGLPHPSAFPYNTVNLEVYSPDADIAPTSTKAKTTMDISVTKDVSPDRPNNLSVALQYGASTGSKSLSLFLHDFAKRVFRPAYSDFQVLLHFGNTDGWNKVVNLFCESGDYILIEEHTYPSSQALWAPMGCRGVPVSMDKDGIIPDALECVLQEWEDSHPGTKRPHLLYIVPTGQNPTGSTIPVERKKLIYDICVKYDVIICEDDPYYFLQMPNYTPASDRCTHESVLPAQDESVIDEALLDALVPTFVSLDYQGRVIRLETFSKTMGPGNRLGYFVCNPLFSERLVRASEVTTQAPAGWSQAIVEEHLKAWKYEGYIRWLFGLRQLYTIRRDWLCDLIFSEFDVLPSPDGIPHDYIALPKGHGKRMDANPKSKYIFSFSAPKGGMFVWVQLNLSNHPKFEGIRASGEEYPEEKLETQIWMELIREKLLLTPGSFYSPVLGPNQRMKREKGVAFFRLAFSFETREDMEKGVKRMARVFERSWGFAELLN
ncbi:PLP-dependent transferase [Dendrothele bispora CBS 962.96]|uniref:PLP-dependent transferase n=1 Tax=Dendrothele bispora (strain CBS 962.96) TaxID=1314807 RepID=A0A4S8KTJ5_DENBC|nr:PLP-dependent transferase [Dendrothele bispora CBS 962.96]